MKAALARMILGWATGLLRHGRPGWAAAVEIEFNHAERDKAGLSFACGCLTAAMRDLPFHGEGRFRLISLAVASILIAPIAGLNLLCSAPGFDFIASGTDRYHAMLAAGGAEQRALAEAYRAAVPLRAIGMVALALLHLQIAWTIARGRFRRLLYLWPATCIVATALLASAFQLFPDGLSVAPTLFAGLAVELITVPALLWWKHRVRCASTDSRKHRA